MSLPLKPAHRRATSRTVSPAPTSSDGHGLHANTDRLVKLFRCEALSTQHVLRTGGPVPR